MQPLTRHGHRGHAVFVLPARPRRAAGTGRQPHPPCEKRAPPRRAPIAPPAAPPQKSLANHTPRHAAGRPRTAKARAVWQPHRAPPRRENSPVSRTPHAAHHLPVCRVAKTLGPAAMPCAPPRPATKIVLLVAHRTPRTIAPPAAPAAAPTAPAAPAAPAAGRPRAAKARAVWQPHRARPRRKILLLAARRDPSPRCRAAAKSPAKHPTGCTPSQSAPPGRTGGGAFPVCPFRSFLQHEPQRAIAKASAARSPEPQRGRMSSGARAHEPQRMTV